MPEVKYKSKEQLTEILTILVDEILNTQGFPVDASLYSAGFDSFSVLLLSKKILENVYNNPPTSLPWLFSCDSIKEIINEFLKIIK